MEPISRLPTTKSPASTKIYILQSFIFGFILFSAAISTIAIAMTVSILLFIPLIVQKYVPEHCDTVQVQCRQQYINFIRITKKSCASAFDIMVGLLCPNTKIILTGDHAKLQTIDKFTMFANHQLYCDWIYIFLLARHFDRHGDIKFMLIQLVQKIPLIGQVVTIWDLLFMQRKLELDKFNILANMKRQREYASHLPLWMVIFPEGTLNTPETRAKCREFAKKHDITEDPKYVLLPKSTGLFMVTDALKTQLNDCFDITIGYSGLEAVDIPMDYYMPGEVFFGQRYPKEIHVHVKHYQVNQQPGFDDQVIDPTKPLQPDSTTKNFVQIFDEKTDQRRLRFSNWVTKRFMEKDERMKDFYEDGGFDKAHQHAGYKTNEKDIWEVNPNANDVMLVLTTWVIGYTLANFYWWTFVKLISVIVTISRFVLRI